MDIRQARDELLSETHSTHKKGLSLFGLILLLLLPAAYFHARQTRPVSKEELDGVYQNTRNAKDTIYLQPHGEYERKIGRNALFRGTWSLKTSLQGATSVRINFKGMPDGNESYKVSQSFWRGITLYDWHTHKEAELWTKMER